MAEIWKPQLIEVYQEWIEHITVMASDKLNSWEIGFIESIEGRLSNNWNLTEGQASKLKQIYTKHIS